MSPELIGLLEVSSVTTGSSNTIDALEEGPYPFFDRSQVIKRSNKFLFDTEAVIVPGEGMDFIPRYTFGKFDLHQRAYAVIPKDNIDGRYLYYAVLNNKRHFSQVATGSTVKSLRLKSFELMRIPFVDMELQKKISSVLASFDYKIDRLGRINDNLQHLLRSLYDELIVSKTYDFINIGKVARVFSGGTPNTSKDEYWGGEYPWLSSGETRNPFIIDTEKTITKDGIDNSSTRLAHKLNTVIASAGQGLTRGQTSILFLDTFVNQSIVVVDSDSEWSFCIYCNLSSRYQELRDLSDSSSIRGSITTGMISELETPLPSKEDLNKFNSIAAPILVSIENNLMEVH